MKFTTSVAALLLAGTALAAPTPMSERLAEKLRVRRAERMAQRAESRRSTRPLIPFLAPSNISENMNSFTTSANTPDSEVTYSSNWAGAVVVTTGVTSVTGTFTVPTVKEPSGGSSNTEYGASAWVGIDGDTCGSAILQTGVDFLVEGSETAYQGWYEWYPAYSYEFTSFNVAPGNVVKATVVATSKTAGTATLENVSTGQTVTHTFSNEASEGSLCETNAEWIVEDFESGSSLVPFANFGSVTFTGASYTSGGTSHGVSGATIFDVQQNGKTETSCGITGTSEVYCNYES